MNRRRLNSGTYNSKFLGSISPGVFFDLFLLLSVTAKPFLGLNPVSRLEFFLTRRNSTRTAVNVSMRSQSSISPGVFFDTYFEVRGIRLMERSLNPVSRLEFFLTAILFVLATALIFGLNPVSRLEFFLTSNQRR